MAEEVKEDLKRFGLLGSTSVSADGAPVFGPDLADPEEKSAQQVVVAPLPQAGAATPLGPLGSTGLEPFGGGGGGGGGGDFSSGGGASAAPSGAIAPWLEGRPLPPAAPLSSQGDFKVEDMLDRWVDAKRRKDFTTADGIRNELRAKGIEAEKKRPGFDQVSRTPKPAPPPEVDVEIELDRWVAAKRAKDFGTADRIRSDLRIRGVEPDAARPNWMDREGGSGGGGGGASGVPLPGGPPPPWVGGGAPPPWVTSAPPPPGVPLPGAAAAAATAASPRALWGRRRRGRWWWLRGRRPRRWL